MNEDLSHTATLEKEGWSRQFVASEPRLSEAVEMYREAGFDVHLVPLLEESTREGCAGLQDTEACRVCFEGSEDLHKVIYTRPKEGKTESADDLF